MLGATFCGGFYQAHPDVTRLNLLPLALVPLFVTVHVVTLWSLTRRSQPIVQSTGHAYASCRRRCRLFRSIELHPQLNGRDAITLNGRNRRVFLVAHLPVKAC
jgi:hypothetical protein